MKVLVHDGHKYELVESVPKGYTIWRIGKHMIDGYLPLCEPKSKGSYYIRPDTLKAIKLEGAQTVLEAAINLKNFTPESVERYIKKNQNSKSIVTQYKVDKMRKALPIMKTIIWE